MLWVALMGIAFAGCIEAESSTSGQQAQGGPQVASGPAEFDETTGAVEGIVTDTELAPISGGVVGLLKDDTIAEDMLVATDAAGHFTINRVPPGSHVLAASALGFTATSKRLEVEVGKVATVQLALEKIAIEEAYSFTQIKKASMSAVMYKASQPCNYTLTGYNTLLKTCGGARTGCSPSICETHYVDEFDKNSTWKSIVAEMTWQPQSGATGKAFLLDLNAPNITRGSGGSINQGEAHTWPKMQGKAPIIIRIDNPETLIERKLPEADWYSYEGGTGCTAPGGGAPNCDWFFRIFGGYCDLGSIIGNCDTLPVDYGINQDNPITLYFSGFYFDPAPATFTALPDR